MNKLFSVITLFAVSLLAMSPFDASALVGANDLRLMQRNATNAGNLAIDLPFPSVNALVGIDINSTWDRIDGGVGTYQVFLLGGGLNYDSPSSTLSVANVPQSSVTGLGTSLAAKFDIPAGSTSQYVRGDGSLATLPAAGVRTFNYPSRALSSCFQISATQDADFHYRVDIATGLSLTTGAQGTVTATSYTNSGCTTGAQVLVDSTSSQTGTLIVGLGINQIASAAIDGTVPSGKWLKLTTANTVGAPTFTIRTAQSEVLLP